MNQRQQLQALSQAQGEKCRKCTKPCWVYEILPSSQKRGIDVSNLSKIKDTAKG